MSTGEHKLLIVDDDGVFRGVMAEACAATGFPALAAGTREDALQRLRDHPGLRLLLTDINLSGGVDGFILAREARLLRPDLALIFLSGSIGDIRTGSDLAEVPILRKPVPLAELRDEIGRALA